MRNFDTLLAGALALALVCLCAPIAYAADAAVKIPTDGGSDVAASVPTANPVPTPTTPTEAIKIGKNAVAAARAGNWWLFSALVIIVLLFVVKLAGTKFGFWKKLGRLRYVIPPVLSLAAAILATFQGGISVDAAVGVFTASWATSSLQELWEHGIMNKPRKGTSG